MRELEEVNEKWSPAPPKQEPEQFGFDCERVDLESEQLKETKAGNTKDDNDFENLIGPHPPLGDNFTCRPLPEGDAEAGICGKSKTSGRSQRLSSQACVAVCRLRLRSTSL